MGATSVIVGPTENAVIVSLNRPFEEGPVDETRLHRLNRLRPHIARSAFLSARMRLEKARAVVQALEALGLPAAGLSAAGKLTVANSSFQALTPSMAQDWRERLKLTSPTADRTFEAWLKVSKTSHGAKLGHSFPIAAFEESPPTLVHIIPISGATRDLFTAVSWLMVMIPVSKSAGVDSRILEGLFDLTAAEARVVKRLLSGLTIEEIAVETKVSQHTIRTQLKAIFRKTGAGRQAELVSLLGRL